VNTHRPPSTPATSLPTEPATDTAATATKAAIELRDICKRFGKVQANQDINLTVQRGTIHGIVGENGAGKSTLMSILYGFYQADSGSILINGVEQKINNSREAIAAGIGMVHQHFMLVDTFSTIRCSTKAPNTRATPCITLPTNISLKWIWINPPVICPLANNNALKY